MASSTPSTMEATTSEDAGAASASTMAALTDAENTSSSSSSISSFCSLSFLRIQGENVHGLPQLLFGCRSSEESTEYPCLLCQDLFQGFRLLVSFLQEKLCFPATSPGACDLKSLTGNVNSTSLTKEM